MASTAKLMETSFKAGRRTPRTRRRTRLRARGAKGGARFLKAMPAKGKAAKGSAKAGAKTARSNAYLQALMHDEALRDSLEDAYGSLSKVYGRAAKKDLGDALLDDRKSRRELRKATASLRRAADRLSGASTRRRRKRGSTVVLVVVAGGVGALALSEDLRSRVLGMVSGGGSSPDQSSNGSRPSAPVENAPTAAAS